MIYVTNILIALAIVSEILATIYIAVGSAFELNPAYIIVDSWKRLQEKLNLAGCIICIIPIGIISLPGTIISSVLIGIYYGANWFWKGFMHVFRKRK